ncbi:MAG: hypothetical protein OXK74_10540 [Gemmatimonadota bacterium]|nr:hypothetical protein [Gemmatimonadota bacterium]
MMNHRNVWHRRLRMARTLFVHRWHAAQTVGEWFGNESVGERFEQINHVRSLAQYVWRCGPFCEEVEGTGRVALPDAARSLRAIVKPVAARGRGHFEQAVRYAARFGADAPSAFAVHGDPDLSALLGYVAEHADIRTFASELAGLHRAMLRYYVQMRYLTPEEAETFRRGRFPLLTPLRAPQRHPADEGDGPLYTGPLPGDLSGALLNTFARNIHHALACRARAELIQTLSAHAQGNTIATEARGGRAGQGRTFEALLERRRTRFVVHDQALASMLASIREPPMHPVIQWLAVFKTAVSTMITAMPVFIVKNFFRDTLAGFVAGRYPQVPFGGTLAGGVQAVRDLTTGRSEPMREYLLQGGFYSGLVESETHLADIRGEDGRVRKGPAARQSWSRLVYALTRPAWIAEAGTRVNQFQRARQAGATKYAAARAARMVSSDFANIGSSRGWRMYVHTVPFLNAAIQGLDQLYQIFRKPRRGDPAAPPRTAEQRAHIRKVIWSGACLAALSCVAWTFNGSTRARELAYQGETDYDKASWVTLYDVAGDTDIRIPVPFQIGAAFIKLPEVALDLVAGRETLAGPKFVWSLVHGNLAVGWIPAVAQPIVEIRTNRNFFGNEIIPPYMANWPAERQYFDRSTPLPYRGVGAALNVSPLHVQTIVRGWTGHLGNAAVVALDEAMWNERTNGPKPFPKTVRLLTGVYSLQPPRPRTYTRFGNEFYAISDWAEGYARSGACSGLGNARQVPAVCRARTLAGRTARDASELRRQGDDVRTNRSKSRRTKERELEALYAQIDGMFRLALPELRELRGRGFDMVGAPAPATRSTGVRRTQRTQREPRQRTRPTRRRR